MKNSWRYSAKSISKHKPLSSESIGNTAIDEWVGFFQIGKEFNGSTLTFDLYAEMEKKYIDAAILFFNFHQCNQVVFKSVEINDFSNYKFEDRKELNEIYQSVKENLRVNVEDLQPFLKLLFREFIWAELFCEHDKKAVLRFGYDYYMYFNSDKDVSKLLQDVERIGLFIGR